ncbi:MAG: hypothetical protein NC483_00340 [Ruminococcus sp.]|nr:hypothetical protein [Ruminococcus sp.]
MKFERNKNSKKHFWCGLIIVVVLTITVTFITSKANYRMTASIPLTEGKVVSSPYDVNVMAMYINEGDGNYQELSKDTTLPTGYTINKEETYCCKGSNCKKENKDTNAILETIGGIHTFRGISKGDKCFIYLDKDIIDAKTMSELLETHYTGRKTREEGTFNKTIENTTIGVIYEGEDDDGTTYYFAGNPLDNWVEFGGYYWRIIRINGDGSIRIIYQGRTKDENGNKLEPQATGEETIIGKIAFNENGDDNKYVGYWYEQDVLRGLKQPSLAYLFLDDWFKNSNIKEGTNYFDKIDLNAGFCGDRTPYADTFGTKAGIGIGKVNTYYRSVLLCPSGGNCGTGTNATYHCESDLDLYTYKNSNKGNRILGNPVGLITSDDVSYAGGIYWQKVEELTYNKKYYLYTNIEYWTMSPLSISFK